MGICGNNTGYILQKSWNSSINIKQQIRSFFFNNTECLNIGLHVLARQMFCHLNHSISIFFVLGCQSQGRVSWTICLGWPWTTILLISASWIARITGINHRHLARIFFYLWLDLIVVKVFLFLFTKIMTEAFTLNLLNFCQYQQLLGNS
jgi:hypothetical protein